MKNTTTISIDLAKTVFQVAVFNKHGNLKSNQVMSGPKMAVLIAQHPEASICMEACGSAHHWACELIAMGHEIRLMPAACINPHVKRGKLMPSMQPRSVRRSPDRRCVLLP